MTYPVRGLRGAGVEAVTKIPGQWYDWGKSRKILDRILAAA